MNFVLCPRLTNIVQPLFTALIVQAPSSSSIYVTSPLISLLPISLQAPTGASLIHNFLQTWSSTDHPPWIFMSSLVHYSRLLTVTVLAKMLLLLGPWTLHRGLWISDRRHSRRKIRHSHENWLGAISQRTLEPVTQGPCRWMMEIWTGILYWRLTWGWICGASPEWPGCTSIRLELRRDTVFHRGSSWGRLCRPHASLPRYHYSELQLERTT